MRASRVVLVALAAACAVCGGKGAGPTLTVTDLSISPGTDLIKINETQSFTATASYNNGTDTTVQATWGSDNPSAATVDSRGLTTGVGSGQATIYADFEGHRGTRLLRVVPNYHGRWQGDWTVTACGEEGDWTGACQEFAPGSLFALTLSATQSRDSISGTTDFGDNLPGSVSGTIDLSGHLNIGGTYTMTIEGIALELTVSNWNTVTVDNQRMTGQFRLTIRAAGLSGSLRNDGRLHVVSKMSQMPLAAAGPGAQSLGQALVHILRRGQQ